MATNNGNGSDPAEVYRRHIQSVERYRHEAAEASERAEYLRAESERIAALAEDWADRSRDYRARAVQAGAAEDGLRRSKMSARAKSEYIEALKAEGLSGEQLQQRYFELPW